MLLANKTRLFGTAVGLGALFFLSAAQVGLLVGWCNTNSAIIRNAGTDVWVIAEQTPCFDYGTPIPSNRVYQVRSVAGVEWAEGMIVTWTYWQRGDGRRVLVEMVGLDTGSVGGPWRMKAGRVEDVHLPDSVIVDELSLSLLGVDQEGAEAEVMSRRAVVCGVSKEVRTFTASPFVFTSMHSAVKYDPRYHADEITYVLVRCAAGYKPDELAASLRASIPHVEVLTTGEFATRSVKYWMLETGVGITVGLTAILGIAVSLVVTSQTLFMITQEHLGDYATLLALGFRRIKLLGCLLAQSLLLGGIGVSLGSAAFAFAARASIGTPIPLETTFEVYTGLVILSLACSLVASLISVRAICRVDPVAVFRA
jgi:putative ABC transport system permease protein